MTGKVRRKPPPKRRKPLEIMREQKPGTAMVKRTSEELVISPRGKMALAARGKGPVQVEDLLGMLSTHLLDEDEHMMKLDLQRGQLLDMMLAPQEEPIKKDEEEDEDDEKPPTPPVDPAAILDLVSQFSRLHNQSAAGFCRAIELMHRISGSPRPSVQVIATGEQINVGAQQINTTSRSKDSF